MHTAADRRDAAIVSLAAVIVLIASVMPWAKVPGPSLGTLFPGPSIGSGFPGPLSGLQFHITLNAWNGNLRLFGVEWPHSLVVLIAVVLTILVWLKALGHWTAPRGLLLGLAGYGLFHMLWFVAGVATVGTIGIGALLSAAAFVGVLIVLKQGFHRAGAVPPPTDASI
jgi:hypothetical protein